ncbi:hypothetical protein SS50377_26404 [Spironucleus salmonicida]|uniref:Uncharacterized protein n=1 Tax=Spironucleus salmonicida TaxID=348837 RepID=V6LT28_9EUKA|nr:hypothetical protein SS50377_26404 [Spironucleus salmonicida]|eukprot:EST47730.1 hypothetical protein SS50377_fx040 [Spironucleus salmonicida]
MIPQKFQDSENLRTLTLAQRMNTFQTVTKAKPLDIHQTLKNWSRQTVKTSSLTQRVKNPEFEIPKSPNLSYATAAKNPEQSILQNYIQRHESQSQLLINNFVHYLDTLIVASYDDLSKTREDFQYQMSSFECQYLKYIDDDQIKPIKLILQMNQIRDDTTDFLSSIVDKINRQNDLLISSTTTETIHIVDELFTNSQTEEQITSLLLIPLDDFNDKQVRLIKYQQDFIISSQERAQITKNDFLARAQQVMRNRRKVAAEVLIRDFRDFVIQQNEWNNILTAAVNDCNCQNQQISASVHDAMSGVYGAKRVELFALIRVFLQGRHEARYGVKNLYSTYSEVYNALLEAQNRTIDALTQINMPGTQYVEMILQGWETRWNKRIELLKQQSELQMKDNGFYVAGIVIMFSFIEKIKLESHANDIIMQSYFDKVLNSLETRFQRDLQRYNGCINTISVQYKKIWNINEVQKMSEIALKLIQAMDLALKQRQNQLEVMTVNEDNIFSKIITDKMFEEVQLYIQHLVGTDFKCESLECKKSVQWNNGRMQIKELDEMINERDQDFSKEGASEKQNSIKEDSNQPQRSSSSKKSDVKKVEQKKQDPKKPVQYQLNEQGLYMDLPLFDNIDQAQYIKDHGFSFGQDNVSAEQIGEAIKISITDPNEKKKEVKKGKDDVVMNAMLNAEIGQTIVNVQTQNGQIQIQLKITADIRLLMHLAILMFMQEEGIRKAFNQSVQDFHKQIKQWEVSYISILNEVSMQKLKDSKDNWIKEKAAIEKRNKSKKKDTDDEEIPPEPQEPDQIVELPLDVIEKLQHTRVPQQKEQDTQNIYLTLVYQLLPYEELKKIPFAEKYQIDIDEVMFETIGCLDSTPTITAPQTRQNSRPGTGTTSRKVSAQQDKKGKQKVEQKTDQIILPKPYNIKEFWTDARLVTHGQSTILQMLVNQVVSVELAQILEKSYKCLQHYKREGNIIRQKSSQDTYGFLLQLQSHKMTYVQQAVQSIESQFAIRNGISQRLIEKVNHLVSNISVEHLQCDSRYDQLLPICQRIFPVQENTQVIKEEVKGKKDAPKKTENNFQQQADSMLIKNNIAQYVQLISNVQTGQVESVYFQDSLGQSIPLLRATQKEFETIFLPLVVKELKNSPQQVHRIILKQLNAYVYAINNKLETQIIPQVMRQILMMQRQLDKELQEISQWGSDNEVSCDFSFADQTVAFLLNSYNIPQKLVIVENSKATSHPTLNITISLIQQLDMMKQDIESKFSQDIYLIKRVITSLSKVIETCNTQQIQQHNKQVLVQRETSKLQALITGRFTSLDAQLDNIKANIKNGEKLFALQYLHEDMKQSKSVLQSLTMKNNSRSKSSISSQKQLTFVNDQQILSKSAQFVQNSLNLEFIYYLLSYERQLTEVVYLKSSNYTLALEQYQQRQKAFNSYFGLFSSLVTMIDKLFVNKDKMEFQQILDLCSNTNQFIGSNKYETKNKIYVNNDTVDIGTQFASEYNQLIAKFPGIIIQKDNIREKCVTEQDWVNYYINKMVDRLDKSFSDLRIKCQSIVAQRDSTMQIILNNYRQYSQKLIIQLFTQQRSSSVLQSQKFKEEFLKHFNGLYDKVRPVLKSLPEKKAQLLEQGLQFYNSMKVQLSQYAEYQDQEFSLQIQFLLLSVLVPHLLFSLYPSIPNSSSVSLQISTLIDIFTKDDTVPVKEAKVKTPVAETRKLVLLQEIDQIQPSSDEVFASQYVKCVKCLTQNLNSKQIIFDISKIDQKVLLSAQNNPKPQLMQPFAKAQLIPVADAESLEIYRQNESRPASKLGEKPPAKGAPILGKQPVLINFNIALQNLVLADDEKSMKFGINVSVPVSNDKLSVEYGSNIANACYQTIDGCCSDTSTVKNAFEEVNKVIEQVWIEFQEALTSI